MIRYLNSKDSSNFITFCQQRDNYSDFYIIENHKRIYLNDVTVAKRVFNTILKHGDIGIISEENGEINGILLITGFFQKSPYKYLKLFSKNLIVIDNLLKFLLWNYDKEIYLKLKKHNPILKFLQKIKNDKIFYKYPFQLLTTKESEVLLLYKPEYKIKQPIFFKDKDEDK